jgi:hypothetical protein
MVHTIYVYQVKAIIVLDMIGITDTTGSMSSPKLNCFINNRRHGNCVVCNFHCSSILAYNHELIIVAFAHSSYICLLPTIVFIS